MPTSTYIAAAAIAGGVALGAAGGALIGSPGLSGAVEDADAATTTLETGGPMGRGLHHRGERGAHLETAAEAIGITADELRSALADGQSIAQVAEANGVDVQVVIDALVADANERIEEAVADGRLTAEEGEARKAEAAERIAELVEVEGLPMGPRARLAHGLETAAEAIGITPEELRTALQDGQSIADVAEANGVDVDVVVEALVAEATERIEALVEREGWGRG